MHVRRLPLLRFLVKCTKKCRYVYVVWDVWTHLLQLKRYCNMWSAVATIATILYTLIICYSYMCVLFILSIHSFFIIILLSCKFIIHSYWSVHCSHVIQYMSSICHDCTVSCLCSCRYIQIQEHGWYSHMQSGADSHTRILSLDSH